MARARNIKPGFFTNDLIAEMTPWARLTFIGLWTLADKAGRMLYRPKKIKMELFPGDNIDVEPLIDELIQHGFVEVYETDGITVLSVINFSKHQNPHPKEKETELPPKKPGESTVREKPRQAVESNDPVAESGDPTVLIPDVLIPDSGCSDGDGAPAPEHEKPPKPKVKRATQVPKDFAVTDNLVTWGESKGFTRDDLEGQVERFMNHHTAKGTTYKDWHAAFQNWMYNARDYGHLKKPGSLTVHPGGNGKPSPGKRGYTMGELIAMSREEGVS